jgi:hypothetical protein
MNTNVKLVTKYFVVIIFEGKSDEIGNMKGVEASTQEEFEYKLREIYGTEHLASIKNDPNDTYWTFYEVDSKEHMDNIVTESENWYLGKDADEEMLMVISEQGKTFNKIVF